MRVPVRVVCYHWGSFYINPHLTPAPIINIILLGGGPGGNDDDDDDDGDDAIDGDVGGDDDGGRGTCT